MNLNGDKGLNHSKRNHTKGLKAGKERSPEVPSFSKRKLVKEDGRYIIFYSFSDDAATGSKGGRADV